MKENKITTRNAKDQEHDMRGAPRLAAAESDRPLTVWRWLGMLESGLENIALQHQLHGKVLPIQVASACLPRHPKAVSNIGQVVLPNISRLANAYSCLWLV